MIDRPAWSRAGRSAGVRSDRPATRRAGPDRSTVRLDLADTRSFTTAGAGQARRTRIAAFLDDWLQRIWADATKGRRTPGLALVSVGSLARQDCGPLSDLDLVLLHEPRVLGQSELDALADQIWYPIWDAAVKLDHSVRTMSQCRHVAEGDLSAAVGLLDLRHIAGDTELVNATRSTVAHDWRGNARTRLPQLVESVSARHARQGELAHLIEPDLKEARGGLRDMAVLRALTQAWLADRPHGQVDAAYLGLLDVRDAVHVVTGRGRDRLMLADHDAVAALLGYAHADDLLTATSQHARTIAYALDATMRRAAQAQRARALRSGPRRPTLAPLGYGLFLHDGEVVLGSGVDPANDPLLVFRAALIAARNQLPMSPATLANLAEHSQALPLPWPPEALALFGDLLAAGPGLVQVWEGLDLAGVVESWIPEWAAVRSRPQRNLVHRHTVDRHLIETVIAAAGLLRQVARPDLLLLAALLHDIGKVPGSPDHSETGARSAVAILDRLGVTGDDTAVVVRLVREHLTLMHLATRRDPADPKTIEAVLEAVGGSADTLDQLVVLSEADAVAAGPLAWTDWRAQLFRRLVASTRAHLTPGPDRADAEPTAELSILTPELIAQLAAGQPCVTVRSHGGVHRVDIVEQDRHGLFADTAGLFAASGFVVRSALVRTVEGIAANEWHVESPGGHIPDPEGLARALARLAGGDRAPLAPMSRRRHAAPVSSASAGTGLPGLARALVLSHASDTATVIEVRAADRPGLLHDIGVTLAGAGLDIRSAHISTYAGQALDTFYVTELESRRLSPARVAEAVAKIIDTCETV